MTNGNFFLITGLIGLGFFILISGMGVIREDIKECSEKLTHLNDSKGD